MSPVLFVRGRLIADVRPVGTPYGTTAYDWTLEDLDADGDMLVASGRAADLNVAAHEIRMAALADVRRRNGSAS